MALLALEWLKRKGGCRSWLPREQHPCFQPGRCKGSAFPNAAFAPCLSGISLCHWLVGSTNRHRSAQACLFIQLQHELLSGTEMFTFLTSFWGMILLLFQFTACYSNLWACITRGYIKTHRTTTRGNWTLLCDPASDSKWLTSPHVATSEESKAHRTRTSTAIFHPSPQKDCFC